MKTKERDKMKKSLFHIGAIAVVLIAGALSQSCTKLDEKLYSSVTPSNFFKTEEEFISALGAAYTQFGGWGSGDPQTLQEMTTDEMTAPTRGQDWDDGGNWRRAHLHSWTKEDGVMSGAWNFGFNGVNTANRLIYQFTSLVKNGQVKQEVADAYIAELQTVRGFFYWQLIDMFGNVPLVTDFATAEATPATKSRAEVYAWVVSDLEAAVPKLSEAVDGTTYGRMNKWAGKMLLAKLYLNAKVYTGTAAYDKAIAACNDIINSGKYSLEPNYFANFNINNAASKEFIFAIPYDKVFYKGFNLVMQTLSYLNQQTYNLQAQPWNGFCSLEEFYNSYDNTDLRKGDFGTLTAPQTKRGNFLAGYQYSNAGAVLVDDGVEKADNPTRLPAPFFKDPDGPKFNFGSIGTGAPQINELGPQAWRQAGVRIGKWEFEVGGLPDMSNDYAVFRYGDVLLMKAEALWRTSNSATDAAALLLVNQIRARAGVTALTTLDGKLSFDLAGASVPGGELFNEMGREMAFEKYRRQSMIRWGVYTDVAKWALPRNNPGDAIVSTPNTNLFPVHKDKIAANPNFVQNPGY
jgi:starch-binding outer membrane protein, SusD/RagB family